MGPVHGDEINIPEPGKNYGWPVVSQGSHYNGDPIPGHASRPEFAPPAWHWYPAISPSGFIFYQGSHFPEWRGNAFIGGLSGETLARIALQNGKPRSEERLPLNRRIRDIAEAKDGALLVLSDGKQGELLRLTKAPKQ